jgi:hypothetical protein
MTEGFQTWLAASEKERRELGRRLLESHIIRRRSKWQRYETLY